MLVTSGVDIDYLPLHRLKSATIYSWYSLFEYSLWKFKHIVLTLMQWGPLGSCPFCPVDKAILVTWQHILFVTVHTRDEGVASPRLSGWRCNLQQAEPRLARVVCYKYFTPLYCVITPAYVINKSKHMFQTSQTAKVEPWAKRRHLTRWHTFICMGVLIACFHYLPKSLRI